MRNHIREEERLSIDGGSPESENQGVAYRQQRFSLSTPPALAHITKPIRENSISSPRLVPCLHMTGLITQVLWSRETEVSYIISPL